MKDEKITMVLLAGVAAISIYLIWRAKSAAQTSASNAASTDGFAQVINNYNTNSPEAPQPTSSQPQVATPMAAVMANTTITLPSITNYGIDIPGSTSTAEGVAGS
jgi:hypothetical protein